MIPPTFSVPSLASGLLEGWLAFLPLPPRPWPTRLTPICLHLPSDPPALTEALAAALHLPAQGSLQGATVSSRLVRANLPLPTPDIQV